MSTSPTQRLMRHGMLPQLRLFEASARLGSFTRAAQELHLSQPAASLQIKKLSETLGVALFEQVGKRIYLTEAGHRVLAGCQQILRTLDDLDQGLAALRTLSAGRLRLAVSTTGMCFAPRLLGAFMAEYPQVQASVQAHNRSTLVERLQRNEDDLYLFAARPDLDDVVLQELLPNPLVVLARDDHPLAQARAIPFERLAEEPFLLREEGSGTRRAALRLFHQHGLEPRVRLELSTNEAIKEAILAGMGVAILSRHTFGLDPESSRYRCLDVQGFPIENHWYFAYPQGKQLSPAVHAFLDLARRQARELMLESLAREPA